ncbi:nucleotide sugar dehydrogenase [Natronomonas halophila]|uniref:nucleotide sugar dehydrogenase n=1 Tax=Natronomonas halophila TaxID=2747817 RepID=UPI0015B52AB6|nr:nucleotide sugar dehydrogenase [Natronomonas halophila]QLD86833.1 nucleotide sugar dehydrogenase [Natronomonas halophila]
MSEIEKVVVVGTGFVGLPLALQLAKNEVEVVGVDIDENLTKAINDASLNLDEEELQRLLEDETVQENLIAQTTPEEGDAFVISVPTPLTDPEKSPDLSHVEAAIESVLPYIESGDVLNVESTIPPRTCETLISNILGDADFTPGEDVHLAHSPERILPGDVFEEIVHNDRIIGGTTPECAEAAAEIYEPFLQGDVYTTDLLSAELCKLMENTFRDINVAIANEFALIGDELDIDIEHVIELANKHPRVDILTPGIGVGGHCLPIDPWFLNEVDPEHTNLITTARRVNDLMPDRAAKRIRRLVAEYTDPDILALGMAYKPDTYDQRNSPARAVVEDLRLDGYSVSHYDRHAPKETYDDLRALVEREGPDVIVELVAHDETVAELNELREWLADQRILAARFEGAAIERLTPSPK